jgi:hypothetical protein
VAPPPVLSCRARVLSRWRAQLRGPSTCPNMMVAVARSPIPFTGFVPLPFVHRATPIYRKGRARRGPTFREAVLMHSVARLVLHPHITNIQGS